MDKVQAIRVANWMYKALDDYMEHLNNNGKRVDFPGESTDWASGEYARASSMGTCPKVHAAERHNLPEAQKAFSGQEKLRFEYGRRTADMVCEALEFAETNDFVLLGREERISSVNAEYKFAGTMDGLVRAWFKSYPLEIKFTAANRYTGFASTQIWQLITYMELRQVDIGYLYTVYGGDSTPTHAVWTVIKEQDVWRIYNLEGEQVESGDDFVQTKFDAKLKSHQEWYELFKTRTAEAMTLVPDETESPFNNWQCGYTKLPEYYKTNYNGARAGDKRPNTGYFVPRCPLFMRCWGGLIPHVEVRPDKLEIGTDDDGKLVFEQ